MRGNEENQESGSIARRGEDDLPTPTQRSRAPRLASPGGLYLWWILANLAGVLVGSLASFGFRTLLGLVFGKQAPDSFSWNWSVANGLLSILGGLLLGTAQWLVLRQRLSALTWKSWAFITSVAQMSSFLLS